MVLARKPFKGSVADNVLKWGVGAINIDASRVPTDETITTHSNGKGCTGDGGIYGHFANQQGGQSAGQELGRFPANFIHDGSDEVVEHFPDTTTTKKRENKASKSTGEAFSGTWNGDNSGFKKGVQDAPRTYDGSGSAARFFYVPKVNKKDRNEGLDGEIPVVGNLNASARDKRLAEHGTSDNHGCNRYDELTKQQKAEGKLVNTHPTVKPTDLMHYLIRMVTPAGGVVLDPFMGSGSTGKAAIRHGYDFIGIEMEQESYDVAKARIEWEMRNEEA